jgi:hypothetical protein
MASVDTKDVDLIVEFERDFARTLRNTLSYIFDANADIGNAYIESLANAPFHERLIALHESPIDVASALTGTAVTDEMIARYEDLMVRQDSPRPRPWDEHSARVFLPVPEKAVADVLKLFGYEKSEGYGDGTVLWQLVKREGVDQNLRPRVLIPPPQVAVSGVATGGQQLYDLSFVIDLMSYLTFGRLSPEAAFLILKALTR